MSSNFVTDHSQEPNERTSLMSRQPSSTPSVLQETEMDNSPLTGSPAHLITANGEAGAGLTGTVSENEMVRKCTLYNSN